MPLDFDVVADPVSPITADDLQTSADVELLAVRAPLAVGDRLEHFFNLKNSVVGANDAANAKYQEARKSLIELRTKREGRINKGFNETTDEILKELNEKIAAASKRLKANVPKPKFAPDFSEIANFFARQKTFAVAEFAPASGATPEERLIAARENLAAAKKELASAETLPRDLDAVLAAARAQLEKLRADGAPNFRRLFSPSDHTDAGDFRAGKPAGRIEWPQMERRAQGTSETSFLEIPNVYAFMAWAGGPEFEKKILAAIEAGAPKTGVTVAVKVARVAAAQKQFVLAIRQEDSALIELEKSGVFKRERAYHPALHLALVFSIEKIIAAL